MRKTILALVAMLSVAGMGWAEEKEIVKRLKEKGGRFGLFVGADGTTRGLSLERGYNDKDLDGLCELRQLRALGLVGPGFSDAGLRSVGGLHGLRSIYLRNVVITDAGLCSLEGLLELTELHLVTCPRVTDAGIARLQKTLPDCDIKRFP
jgi:hypothetical protein